MMLRWGTIVQISNHILATLSGTASAILVKWYLKEKAPGLQTFLDVSIIEATNSYIIFNISCNLSMALGLAFPGMDEIFKYCLVGFFSIVHSNFLLIFLYVFIVKYLIIYHNLMQLTNINERKMILKIRIVIWIFSTIMELVDWLLVSNIWESFGYQLLDTGYIQITQQSYRPYGLYLYSLSIICFIVILIGQVRIEFDYHGEFRVTPLRVAFLSAVIFDVILFLFPHTFSETITANILWQLIVFLGLTVLPISLAYSHNGVRTFANNRWNNFIQSPSIILPNV